jgi:hypothetical protein
MLLHGPLRYRSDAPIEDALRDALRHQAAQSYAPNHPAWDALASRSLEDTLPEFQEWVEACLRDLGSVAGVYIGLNEIGDDYGATYDVRIAGSPWYEREAIWNEVRHQGHLDLRPG